MMWKWYLPATAGLWLLLGTLAFADGHSPFMQVRYGTLDIASADGSEENSSTVLAYPYVLPLVGERQKTRPYEITDFNGNGKDVFETVYEWKVIDFLYPSLKARNNAIRTKQFIPENNLPLGVDRFRDRLFITTPRWNPGVPATLSYVPLPVVNSSAPLIPYPHWDFHTTPHNPDCSKLVSVYRIYIDECDRLWVLDAGVIDTLTNLQQLCPPKLLAFDLYNDRLLFTYYIPPEQVKQDSLHTNLIVDIRNGKCNEAFAYVTDVWRNGITVFSMGAFRSWRTTHILYNPDPYASDYKYGKLSFQWSDGVFGLSMSGINSGDRLVFFHPMSSFTEFEVPASVLRNETIWQTGGDPIAFQPLGGRGQRGQSSTAGITRNGIQFFTLVSRSAIGCWDLAKPYNPHNLAIVERNENKFTFPNDLKLDREPRQNIWVVSNKLPVFLYSRLDYKQINFRVLRAEARLAFEHTICDPRHEANLAARRPPECEW